MSIARALFADGGAIDLVLLVMALEAVLLAWAGCAPRAVLAALLPGACLVLAVRAAYAGAGWTWIALLLAASLPLHLADLRARGWLARRSSRPLAAARLGAATDPGGAR